MGLEVGLRVGFVDDGLTEGETARAAEAASSRPRTRFRCIGLHEAEPEGARRTEKVRFNCACEVLKFVGECANNESTRRSRPHQHPIHATYRT